MQGPGQLVAARRDLGLKLLHPSGHPHGPRAVAEVALDLAQDGRRRVRGELDVSGDVEPIHGLDQPDGAHLHEIVDGLAAVAVAAGEMLDEGQVHRDQLVADGGAPRVGCLEVGQVRQQLPFASPSLGTGQAGARSGRSRGHTSTATDRVTCRPRVTTPSSMVAVTLVDQCREDGPAERPGRGHQAGGARRRDADVEPGLHAAERAPDLASRRGVGDELADRLVDREPHVLELVEGKVHACRHGRCDRAGQGHVLRLGGERQGHGVGH